LAIWHMNWNIATCATCLFLLSGAAMACEKIEYAEVKDWPVEQTEKALCEARKESLELTVKSIRLMGSNYVDYREYTPAINRCDAQAALYERVIQNVHKRPLPNCKYKS
jgi:hypothetical protein